MFEKFFQHRRERERQRIIESMSDLEKAIFDAMISRPQDWTLNEGGSDSVYYIPGDLWLWFILGHLEIRLEKKGTTRFTECMQLEFSSNEVRALLEKEYTLLPHRVRALQIATKRVSP